MKKQYLYILGGIIALFVIFSAVSPKQNTVQNIEQGVPAVTTTDTVNNELVTTNTNPTIPAPKTQVPSTPEAKTSTTSTQLYSVVSVVDGDTVKISIDGKTETFRLIGIDTPETVDPRKPVQCFGVESSNKAKELLSGKKVRIETDASQGTYDKYNRLLAYIYREDGLFYNKYMIEQGYAHEYTYNTPYKYQTEFKNAQKQAQDNKAGLWSTTTCNGDTTKAASTNLTTPATIPSDSQFYTSSYGTSKYYYPALCDGWKGLSPKYLKGFKTLNDLLKAYPARTESPGC